MAQIHNDQQVYALLGRLFESAVADDEVGRAPAHDRRRRPAAVPPARRDGDA